MGTFIQVVFPLMGTFMQVVFYLEVCHGERDIRADLGEAELTFMQIVFHLTFMQVVFHLEVCQRERDIRADLG